MCANFERADAQADERLSAPAGHGAAHSVGNPGLLLQLPTCSSHRSTLGCKRDTKEVQAELAAVTAAAEACSSGQNDAVDSDLVPFHCTAEPGNQVPEREVVS